MSAPKLTDSPINPEWIISGQPRAQAERLARSDDRTVSFVVWDCTCGTFQWHYDEDESFVVTAGEAFLTSSVRGMLPIARLMNAELPAPGPVTRRLWNDILPWLESGGTTP